MYFYKNKKRECWNVGKSIIDADTFFMVSNEMNVFIKSLKLEYSEQIGSIFK